MSFLSIIFNAKTVLNHKRFLQNRSQENRSIKQKIKSIVSLYTCIPILQKLAHKKVKEMLVFFKLHLHAWGTKLFSKVWPAIWIRYDLSIRVKLCFPQTITAFFSPRETDTEIRNLFSKIHSLRFSSGSKPQKTGRHLKTRNGSRHSCLFMGRHRPTSTANNLPPSKPHIRATEHFWKLTQRELFIRIRLGRAPRILHLRDREVIRPQTRPYEPPR